MIISNHQEAIKAFQKQWTPISPSEEFEYHFLDKDYEALYHTEIRTGKIVNWGMGIALFITIIGLFAMANYTTQRRVKEIGVRKVNSAKVISLVAMLNKSFVKWLVISFIIAVPLSYFIVQGWLSGFAYKTTLSWWVFALAGFIALAIALLTVSWQTFRAARRNPVDALKCE